MSSSIALRNRALDELIKTEETYINDLNIVTSTYVEEMISPTDIPVPENLKNKERFIFINVVAILEWHKKFITFLEKCIANPIEFGPIFEKVHRKFEIYATFHHHKYLSNLLVSENQEYFSKLRKKFDHGDVGVKLLLI